VNAKDRLIVALDVPRLDEARALVDRLAGAVGMFKVGSQLFTEAGPAFVHELRARGEKVFLDLKYHDIPNTVGNAVSRASDLGVSLLTVHALGGRPMLEAARAGASGSLTRILAITVLTSHAEDSLGELGISGSLPESVERLARLAKTAGVDGVVASPREVAVVRAACGPGFLVVTPGIRPAGAPRGDQARAATPEEAVAQGADYIVVGRPILAAPDPRAAAVAIVASLPQEGSSSGGSSTPGASAA
jgi:orotidine-5'-phosphate decarboxylase